MNKPEDAANCFDASNCSSVTLQVVIGGDHTIYQKPVLMPILPVGSRVIVYEDEDMYIAGYEWRDGLIICWLASYYAMAHMGPLASEKVSRALFCAALWEMGIDVVPIEWKKKYTDAGFVRSGRRAK